MNRAEMRRMKREQEKAHTVTYNLGFVDKVLEYYGRWEDGELDMDKLKEDLWEYGGIRLEPAQIDMEDISKNNEK